MSVAPKPRGGIAAFVLLLCFAAVVVGLLLDFGAGAWGFWIGARPGGAAAIGAAAAVFAVAGGRIARTLLGRGDARRSGDADPNA
jgi:hypothetical protein